MVPGAGGAARARGRRGGGDYFQKIALGGNNEKETPTPVQKKRE
jgi:hypothetical protein